MSVPDELNDILQEENKAVAVTALYGWVMTKAETAGYDSLSMEEKVIVHVNSLDWELSNRGVNRLIFGSDINFSTEMPECLRRVGAKESAKLFEELLSTIPKQPLPEDKDDREAYFKSLSDREIDNLDLGIRKLFACKEDLFTRLCGYFDSIRGRLANQKARHAETKNG